MPTARKASDVEEEAAAADASALPFADRLKGILDNKYHPSMRRSVQAVLLYEANRCLLERYNQLKPWQRKILLLQTAREILNTLDLIPDYLRAEVMYRTQSSKELIPPDMAWRRLKLIDREIQQGIIPKLKEANLLNGNKNHDEVCKEFIQSQFEAATGEKKPATEFWEYGHMNIFLAYRMFYKGESVDTSLPESVAPRRVEVPDAKPGEIHDYATSINRAVVTNVSTEPIDPDERRALLKEVRDHLELLKEFEGIIPAKDLSIKKKILFAALPSVPLKLPGQGKGKARGKRKSSSKAGTSPKKAKSAKTKIADL